MRIALDKPQLGKIRKAIVDAYIGAGAAALQELDQAFGDYSDGRSVFEYVTNNSRFPLQVGQLLAYANSEGWLPSLLGAVRQDRPEREDLQALLRTVLSTVPAQQALDVATRPRSVPETVRVELQQLLPNSALVTPDTMERRLRAVCRVDYADLSPPAVGTGFLVGPDLVLSNWHVIRRVIEYPDKIRELRFRFDLRTEADASDGTGRVVHASTGGGAVLWHRPAGGSELPRGVGEPSMQQLDYALVRLADRVADDQVQNVAATVRRGYIPLRRSMPQPAAKATVMVLQHPMRGPLQFAMGVALGHNESGSRVRHSAATQRGSSGSPVLDPSLGLVALHNGASPGVPEARQPFNTAVPIAHVVDDLVGKGITEMLQE